MAYNKKTWKNNETKLNADNLNAIENGIEAAATKADEAAAQAAANLSSINGHTTAINGLTTSLNSLTTTVNNNKTNADSKFTSVENRIAAAEQVNNTQNSNISTLGTEITRVEDKFDNSVASLTSSTNAIGEILRGHQENVANPHSVTAEQVGAYTKTKIDTINNAAVLTCPLILAADSARNATLTLRDISSLPQKFLIKSLKPEGYTNGDDYYAGEGKTGLWSVSYDESAILHSLAVDIDLGNFETGALTSGYTYELIKKDINNATIIDYDNNSLAQIPDNYIGTMSYVSPVYVYGSSGLATDGGGDDASQCYTSLIFQSIAQKKYFLIPLGRNNSLYERLIFSIVDDRYLLIKGNFVYKRVIDLKAYGDDLTFWSIGFNNISTAGAVTLYSAAATYPTFALYTDTGEIVVPTTPLFSVGTYEVDITPPANFSYLVYNFENLNTSLVVENSIQYARSDSNLVNLGKNIPSSINMDKLYQELEFKAQRAVKQLITVGTGDPDASTPGLLYFKYLP